MENARKEIEPMFPDPSTVRIIHDTMVAEELARRTPDHPPGTQMLGELLTRRAAGLDEQGAVDRLVRHLHLRDVRVRGLQPARDLLR